jgi:hypothetical protein
MKKLFYLAGIVMLSGALFFSACTDEEEGPDLPPSISFVSGAGLLTGDATLTVNTPFSVKVLCEANAESGANIKTLQITRISENQVLWDTTLNYNDETFTLEATFTSLPDPAVEVIEFEATDKDGERASIDIQITTESAAMPIDTWTERLLGSWNNPTGSSFASINGNVYTLDQAFANQSIIDYMYWWGQSTSATIGAPDDENAAQVFNTGNFALANWTTKNATRFKATGLTSAQFDAITDAADIIPEATGADQTRIGELAADQVIAFITVTNKRGLIRVKTFTEGSDGTMTIDVKVEK